MALDKALLDVIFAKLTVTYGARFRKQYGNTLASAIRRDWADELDGCKEPAVRYALDHLPADHPPNVLQFRALVRLGPRGPLREPDQDERPATAMPAEVKQKLEALKRKVRGAA